MTENTDVITNPGDCQQIVIDNLNREVERLRKQLDELQNDNNNLCNDIVDLNLTIENKEKQLNEANEVIKKYRRFEVALKVEKGTLIGVYPAVDYLKKWGVK